MAVRPTGAVGSADPRRGCWPRCPGSSCCSGWARWPSCWWSRCCRSVPGNTRRCRRRRLRSTCPPPRRTAAGHPRRSPRRAPRRPRRAEPSPSTRTSVPAGQHPRSTARPSDRDGHRAYRSDPDGPEATRRGLSVSNGSGRSPRTGRWSCSSAGNPKVMQVRSHSGLSVSTQGNGSFVLRGTSPFGAGRRQPLQPAVRLVPAPVTGPASARSTARPAPRLSPVTGPGGPFSGIARDRCQPAAGDRRYGLAGDLGGPAVHCGRRHARRCRGWPCSRKDCCFVATRVCKVLQNVSARASVRANQRPEEGRR